MHVPGMVARQLAEHPVEFGWLRRPPLLRHATAGGTHTTAGERGCYAGSPAPERRAARLQR